ncbi:MAG: MFS transporter [Streptosporangiales bacterium]|nr:MFS transporter [Streptosporangiales bacterium]
MNTPTAAETLTPQGRKAVFGAWLGFFVDMFDIYLPIVALAPAAAYFQATDVSKGTAAIISAMIFAATLLGRPIGAVLFGHLADRVGRRRTAIVAVTGFGVITGLIALLPGYQTIGLTAVVLLILLRFVDGIFLGGEYTSATPLALEHSPKGRRGLVGALIMTGYPLAYCAVAAVTFATLAFVPAGGLDSPYVQWGWRIPFVIGALLAFGFVWWFRREVKESPAWEAGTKEKSPVLELFRGANRRNFLQVFVLMTGIWLSLNMVSAVLPGLLADPVGLDDSQISVVLVIAYLVVAGAYVAAGVIAQRVGRRPSLIVLGVLTATVSPLGYALIVGGAVTGIVSVTLLVVLVGVVTLSVWGIITTYINERFHTGVRASGYGLGYSLAVIIPAFYAFYQSGLTAFVSLEYTPLILLVLGGALIIVGAAIGPETRDVDMGATPADHGVPVAEEKA